MTPRLYNSVALSKLTGRCRTDKTQRRPNKPTMTVFHTEQASQPDDMPGTFTWARFIMLFVGFLLLRSLVTFPAENVDALIKYTAAADIVRGEGWARLLENQHTMRWIEVVPQVFVTWVSQFRYEGLYVLPLMAFAGYCTVIVMAMWNHLNKLERLMLAGLLLIEPLALNHTGQLLNPPFGNLFAVLGVLCLSRKPKPGLAWTVLAGALFVCAYGAHTTYLAFAGGAILWMLFRDRPTAIVLGLAVGFFILVETLIFNALSGGELTFGRIEALSQGGHVKSVVSGRFQTYETVNLLARWINLPGFNLVLVGAFLVLAGQLLWRSITRQGPEAESESLPLFVGGMMWAAGIYALSITLAVTDVNPVKPLLPFRNMYLQVLMPFAIVSTVFLISRMMLNWSKQQRLWLIATGGVVMSILFVLMVQSRGQLGDVINSRLSAFVYRADQDLSDYSERFAQGEVLIRGHNIRAMVLLALYQNPVEWKVYKQRNRAAGSLKLSPTALCTQNLQRMPIERNYLPCEGFKVGKRPDYTQSRTKPSPEKGFATIKAL